MNKISAEVLADSVDNRGNRITTFVLTFPRFILAELNTHRLFSRNSASSRAIPFRKMVKMVQDDPFIPIAWQKDHKGMQGNEYWTVKDDCADHIPHVSMRGANMIDNSIFNWLKARDNAIEYAKILSEKGNVTKQLCNRLLEPFMWHKVILTATEFDNFFNLRCPQYQSNYSPTFKSKKEYTNWYRKESEDFIKENGMVTFNLNCFYPSPKCETVDWLSINKGQSEIHMMELAECMYNAINTSVPNDLEPGQYHRPFTASLTTEAGLAVLDYVDKEVDSVKQQFNSYDEYNDYHDKLYCEVTNKVAIARCARISYMTFDGKISIEKDLRLYDSLLKSGHWSPFEQIAQCMTDEEYMNHVNGELAPIEDDGDEVMYTKINISDKEAGWCRNFKGFIQERYKLD